MQDYVSNSDVLHTNLDQLAVDTVSCFEVKASRRWRAAELLLPFNCAPVLLSKGSHLNGLEMMMYLHSGLAAFRLSKF